MARLNEASQPDSAIHDSDHILSPQPRAPSSKEHLLASFETSHLPSDNGLTINDGQIPTQEYEYSSSPSSARHSTSDILGREMDDELEQMKSRASSRSSLSSMPASVLIHPKQMTDISAHNSMAAYSMEEDEAGFGRFDGPLNSIRTLRQREAAFRKPSSVRAMQMHTEDEADEDEYLTPPRRRGIRSPGSSPLKRSPYYSPNASSNKPKAKVQKEYPLVLLHCNLLAPSIPVSGATLPQNQKIVEEILPPEFWRRWRRLQDKVGSGVLRDRGVLIPHPEDLYDMLEERLLESLELRRPRLHQGHFVSHEESGSGSEGEVSDQGESETDGEQDEECPDCGGRVRHGDSNRKWEIKVFAANGLMRAGAWAAAWKEMEKVDVEVGLWLPSDIRRALEKRLTEQHAVNFSTELHTSPPIDRAAQFVMDPRQLSVQTHARTVSDVASFRASAPALMPPLENSEVDFSQTRGEKKKHEVALQTLLINYIRVLAGDRRNVALVLMSILVVFLAIGSHPQELPVQSSVHSFAGSPVIQTTIIAPSPSIISSSTMMTESVEPPIAVSPTPVSESLISNSTEELSSPSILPEPAESSDPFKTFESPDFTDPETQPIESAKSFEPFESPVIQTTINAPTPSISPSTVITESMEPPIVVSSAAVSEAIISSLTGGSSTSILAEPKTRTVEPAEPSEPLKSPESAESEAQPMDPEATTLSTPEPEAALDPTDEELDPDVSQVTDEGGTKQAKAEPLHEPVKDEL